MYLRLPNLAGPVNYTVKMNGMSFSTQQQLWSICQESWESLHHVATIN